MLKAVHVTLFLTLLACPSICEVMRVSQLARARQNRTDLIYNNYLKDIVKGICFSFACETARMKFVVHIEQI